MNKLTYIFPVLLIVVAAALSSMFVVDERERALVLRFGQIIRVEEQPGLGFKLPLLDEVARYDDRILSLATDTFQVTPSDDRRLDVDAFARYRIADVIRFRERFGGAGSLPADQIRAAEIQLGSILNVQVREVLGDDLVTSDTILSEERRGLMNRIRDQAGVDALALGVEIVDVRLVTTNLPEENLDQTFARMRAEREQEAVDQVARGQEAARGIRALAQRTARETVALAQRDSQIVRGEADAQANATLNAAFGADEEFFRFYQSMLNYQGSIDGGNSTIVLTPDSPFFGYFFDPGQGEGLGSLGQADVDQLMEDAVGDMEVQDSVIEPMSPEDLNVSPSLLEGGSSQTEDETDDAEAAEEAPAETEDGDAGAVTE